MQPRGKSAPPDKQPNPAIGAGQELLGALVVALAFAAAAEAMGFIAPFLEPLTLGLVSLADWMPRWTPEWLGEVLMILLFMVPYFTAFIPIFLLSSVVLSPIFFIPDLIVTNPRLLVIWLSSLVASWLSIKLFVDASVFVCFGASSLWLLAAMPAKRECEARNYVLARQILVSLEELFLIVTSVAALYSLASLVVSQMIPDTTTLKTLKYCESEVRSAYKALKWLNKFAVVWLVVLGAAVVTRLWLTRTMRFQQAESVTHAWGWVSAGRSWLGRAYLALLVAASFTFLGAATNGPYAALSARIDDIDHEYTGFRRQLRQVVQQQVQRDAIEVANARAAEQMPQVLAAAIGYASERRRLEEHISKNDREFALAQIDTSKDLPATKHLIDEANGLGADSYDAVSSDNAAVQRDADRLSRSRLDKLAQALDQVSVKLREQPPPELLTGINGELAKQLIEMPMSTPTAALMAYVDHLSSQVPIIGELVRSIIGPSKDFLATLLVPTADRIARAMLDAPDGSLENQIEQAATESARRMPIEVPRNSEDWVMTTSSALVAREHATHDRIDALDSEAKLALNEGVTQNESEVRLLRGAGVSEDDFVRRSPETNRILIADPQSLDIHQLAKRLAVSNRQLRSAIGESPEQSRSLLGPERYEELRKAVSARSAGTSIDPERPDRWDRGEKNRPHVAEPYHVDVHPIEIP